MSCFGLFSESSVCGIIFHIEIDDFAGIGLVNSTFIFRCYFVFGSVEPKSIKSRKHTN